jgi:hypothetical protein
MKHLLAHYANKYGLENVECSDTSLRAYRNGELALSLAKDGAGNLKDESEDLGLEDRHDLSPIPKDGRLYKFDKHGRLAKDEKYSERKELRKDYLKDGRLPSCEELAKDGWKFSASCELLEKPAKA